ncbi:MAG: J domain-containing protein [Myxococcota bacterium]
MARLITLALLVLFAYSLGRRFLKALEGPPLEGERPPSKKKVTSDERDPHEVLGVKPGATQEEIRRCYQAAIRKYHPDYLENMAPELRTLAEQRTKEINRAYEALRKRG